MEKETEPKILSYTRKMVDGKVQVVNRHTKEVANTVHASHFENTEQYVVEPRQRALEQVQAICEKLRGGTGHATLEKDGTIRGNRYKYGHDSSISEMIVMNEDNPALTVTTAHEPKCYGETTGWRIRKLTPVETGRLMGLEDAEIQKMYDAGIPKTQLYKLHGNSIVVDVLFHIFRKMFVEQGNESKQLELF